MVLGTSGTYRNKSRRSRPRPALLAVVGTATLVAVAAADSPPLRGFGLPEDSLENWRRRYSFGGAVEDGVAPFGKDIAAACIADSRNDQSEAYRVTWQVEARSQLQPQTERRRRSYTLALWIATRLTRRGLSSLATLHLLGALAPRTPPEPATSVEFVGQRADILFRRR